MRTKIKTRLTKPQDKFRGLGPGLAPTGAVVVERAERTVYYSLLASFANAGEHRK